VKKIIGLSLSALVILGMVAVGTFAYFSDTETSTGNTITAGTLNLTADESGTSGNWALTAGDDGANEYGTLSLLKPGDSGTITWLLTNAGNLAGAMTITSTVTPAENDSNEPETAAIASNSATNLGLGDLLGVKLTATGSNYTGTQYILGTATNYVPLSGLEAVLDAQTSKTMAASGTITYVLSWALPNDVQKAGTDGLFGALVSAITGTASSGSATTLVDTTKTWTVNAYAGSTVVISGAGGTRTIISNTADTLTFATGGVVTDVMTYEIASDDAAVDDNIIQGDSAVIDITFTLTQS
jgi:predicted ribosomally synthesized peptide with SipW-like signal peptide